MGEDLAQLVARFPRSEFLGHYWSYRPGEHVTLLGSTGSGKTTLAFQLLEVTASPKLPAVVLGMKPRDRTLEKWTRKLGFRKVRSWPPTPTLWHGNPPGWTLWPRHSFDPDRDDQLLYRQFRTAILDSYKRGNRILFADELFGLADELKLDRELITVWSRGRSMECGLWGGTQKPSHVPLWAYSQAEHLFLAYEPDKRARQRFSEIGGVDPGLVESVTMALKKYEWLYIRRDGPALCIVEK